jgi:hypothetical protein
MNLFLDLTRLIKPFLQIMFQDKVILSIIKEIIVENKPDILMVNFNQLKIKQNIFQLIW